MPKRRKPYVVTAHREPGWWIIDVPELDVRTQARRLAEVEWNAREAIGVWLDVDPEGVAVEVTVQAPEDVAVLIEAKTQAAAAQEEADRQLRATVERLTTALGLTVREVGTLTGLSHQRIAQVARHHRRPAKRTSTAQRRTA